ncbi:MAG: gas vesicle protein [Anaerolineae bacterium]
MMEPVRAQRATLVDLLDRILDKGVILDADVVITLAGIPLVGVKLRAALAGMETMLRYGMMEEWDRQIRARELRPLTTSIEAEGEGPDTEANEPLVAPTN